MPGTITPVSNSRGGITVTIDAPGISGRGIDLSPLGGLQLASRILALLGKTSIANNPDGTFTAK